MKRLCVECEGKSEVLQGNIAFASGIVRSGIQAVDGYPGTPSTEVIDKGLSQVQDKLQVGWSVNEAVAVGVGVGHTFAGKDAVVTMKIPGVFQAGDAISSASAYDGARGGLVLYVASDFTPSSTQHLVDPRPFYRSCFLPVYEPRNHQEMHEAADFAAILSRKFRLPVVVHASGALCHSEGLVRLMPIKVREDAKVDTLSGQILLPNTVRIRYDNFMKQRFDAIEEYVEASELTKHIKGKGKVGVIASNVNALYMEEYKEVFDKDVDILSLAFTNPLPKKKIKEFAEYIEKNNGTLYVLDDGYRYLQEACMALGVNAIGKEANSIVTEWSPTSIAEFLGKTLNKKEPKSKAVPRPPMICPGCPYRLTGLLLAKMKKKGELEAVFSDIGCNTLLYFMQALDNNLCMGASESLRAGYVLSKPLSAGKCVSVIGDGTEVHSGLDATRNTLFRNIPGVKIILDNEWIAMTGGQPGAASPVNLAGKEHKVKLIPALEGEGAEVITANAYDNKEIQSKLKQALKDAEAGKFIVLVIQGTCIRKVPAFKGIMQVNKDLCKKCGSCLICPGIEGKIGLVPEFNNLCTSCMGQNPACGQFCSSHAISAVSSVEEKTSFVEIPEAPIPFCTPLGKKPEKLSLAIRGVGGQGNLFFGKVLARMAFLAGYGTGAKSNIIKGETHGMAQMGGPVISTFACGNVFSQDLLPQTADCLIVMEKSEVLRPNFLTMLKKGGTVLMADTCILPYGFPRESYPSDAGILDDLREYHVIQVPILKVALELGDPTGKCANVVMLGLLSKLAFFNIIPQETWLTALYEINSKSHVWNTNYAAFLKGAEIYK